MVTKFSDGHLADKLANALRDLLNEIDNLEGIQFTRDTDEYKAEAVWDDAYSRASKALTVYFQERVTL